jgi:superfamily II DNA or RNA helicase
MLDGYQGTMLQSASEKLDDLRLRMPNAGGLVIAPNIQMAEYMASVLEMIEGESPQIVHSELPNSDNKIRAFRNSDKRWLVSVAMVSEGVDIKRLRVLAYLPYSTTELSFRQAVGRVVRSCPPNDDTRAYVLMPSFETFDAYAIRVEKEMSPAKRKDPGKPKTKTCPVCREECSLSASHCHSCDHEFAAPTPRFKQCTACESLNPLSAKECQFCGHSFEMAFTVSLDEAMRDGAIIRGMSVNEHDVELSEKIAPEIRRRVLSSNDEALVKILRTLPDESWGVLKNIMTSSASI